MASAEPDILNPPREITRADVIAAVCIGLLAFAGVLVTYGSHGMSWDEAYYYPAYVDVWEWLRHFFRSPAAALSPEGIVAGWQEIHELPPVTKWLGAIGVGMAPKGLELEARGYVQHECSEGTHLFPQNVQPLLG